MNPRNLIVKSIKVIYKKITRKKYLAPIYDLKSYDLNRQTANNLIFNMLSGPSACMISRFGTTELICVNNYLCIKSKRNYFRKIIDYIVDNTQLPWWNESFFHEMSHSSGIFPPSIETSSRFSERYLNDIPLIDLLGSFQYQEKFMPLRKDVVKVHLETLYPFYAELPWTRALYGKRVLIVHPFDVSIRNQYKKRELLFENEILPDFELITLRAIQSIANNETPFKDWFEALKYMEDKITDIDFDICILGCGAYGLPLAAHVKRLGKKAIHLGGGSQLLFGIKGKRWESNYKWKYLPESFKTEYSNLYNEYWTRPTKEETPINAYKMEKGAYW